MLISNHNTEYRKGVGAVILNRHNKVFLAKRINTRTEAWQLPQGGIDNDENPNNAIYRELYEEIGTKKLEMISEIDDWLSYDFPEDLQPKLWNGKYKGQTQKWFLFRFIGDDNDIDLNLHIPEFDEWKWVESSLVIDYVVDFKKELYINIINKFKKYLI